MTDNQAKAGSLDIVKRWQSRQRALEWSKINWRELMDDNRIPASVKCHLLRAAMSDYEVHCANIRRGRR